MRSLTLCFLPSPRIAAYFAAVVGAALLSVLCIDPDRTGIALAADASVEIERIEVRSEAGVRSLEAAVLVEAVDGGLLVELPDESLKLLQPPEIVLRATLNGRLEGESPRALGRRILGELPPGFDLHITKHYLICFDTQRAYAQWCGALFERLYEGFRNYWDKADFALTEPRRPLIVVIFSDRQRYAALAQNDLGAATDRVVGYYNLMNNRITTFDLTGSDMLKQKPASSAGRAGLDILASPEASGLVATLVHEATHQLAFNCGMHQRLAPVPLWLSEGIATYFETPDLGSERGWRGIGIVNKPRRERFLARYRPGSLESIVLADEPFRHAEDAIDAYARAWALTYFLVQTRKAAFVSYLKTIGKKQPLEDDSPAQRLHEFTQAFGVTPAAIEEPVMKFVVRLRTKDR